jgi:hypothetical protein
MLDLICWVNLQGNLQKKGLIMELVCNNANSCQTDILTHGTRLIALKV